MVLCEVVVFSTLFSSFVQCSSIITNSIRMPHNSSALSSRLATPGVQLPKPEMLVSTPSDVELQEIYPLGSVKEVNKSTESRSLEKDILSTKTSNDTVVELSTSNHMHNNFVLLKDIGDFKTKERNKIKTIVSELDESKDIIENHNDVVSPQELSRKYWMKYNNFSKDFFTNWIKDRPENESSSEKGFSDNGILDLLQRIFRCFWNSGFFSCIQHISSNDDGLENLTFLQLISPRIPRFREEGGLEDDTTNRKDDSTYGTVEEDEGRKRLSKKLQQLLPFLMILKMTMLPALAAMALVSGKAFLMSLLSLGVALIATFTSASPLSADKRHEISPQSSSLAHPQPTDQIPGKYYYVM